MRHDLRLLLPAAAGWSVALTTQAVPALTAHAGAIAIACAVVGTAAGIIAWWAKGLGQVAALILVISWAASSCAFVSMVHAAALTAEPLHGWATKRLTAQVAGVVTSPLTTRDVRSPAIWQPDKVHEQRLATSQVRVRGMTVAMQVPVQLRLESPSLASPPGTHVIITGRLLAARTTDQVAAILLVDEAATVLRQPGLIDSAANAMRTGLMASLAGLPGDGASLVAGLAIGDESLQPPGLGDAMRDSGLSHLTAVSGGNTAIVVGVVLAVAALARLPRGGQVLAASGALAFYVILVGPQPSVLRAAAMGGVTLAALVLGGRRSGTAALGLSVLVLILLSPGLAISWGFALSVLATGGLILLSPVIDQALERRPWVATWPQGVRLAVSVTIAAQVSTLPVLVLMGSAVGWVSVPANLLAMPAVAAVTVLGIAVAAIAPVAPAIAVLIAHVAYAPAAWIAIVATHASQWPLATIPMPSGLPGLLVLTVLGLFAFAVLRVVRRAWPAGIPRVALVQVIAVVGASAIAIAVLRDARRDWPPPGWLLIACDVGQGDGLLMRAGRHSAVVVDVGPDGEVMRDCLRDAQVDQVEAVVLTHDHADHVLGLERILAEFDVPLVISGPLAEPPEQHGEVLRVVGEAGVRIDVARVGEVRRAGSVTWRVIWPRRIIDAGSRPNNASVVLAAKIDGHEVLLCGDIEPEAQAAIAAELAGINPVAVKIPHHGSRFQHPSLPAWTTPAFAIVSVGQGNDYGHPAESTLDAWRAAGAAIGRTDLDGDIAIVEVNGVVTMVRRGR